MGKILLDVKPFQETLHAHMCGPASLKILLDFYGINKTEKECTELTGLIPGLGIHVDGFERAAKSLGLKFFVKKLPSLLCVRRGFI